MAQAPHCQWDTARAAHRSGCRSAPRRPRARATPLPQPRRYCEPLCVQCGHKWSQFAAPAVSAAAVILASQLSSEKSAEIELSATKTIEFYGSRFFYNGACLSISARSKQQVPLLCTCLQSTPRPAPAGSCLGYQCYPAADSRLHPRPVPRSLARARDSNAGHIERSHSIVFSDAVQNISCWLKIIELVKRK